MSGGASHALQEVLQPEVHSQRSQVSIRLLRCDGEIADEERVAFEYARVEPYRRLDVASNETRFRERRLVPIARLQIVRRMALQHRRALVEEPSNVIADGLRAL